MRFCIGSNQYTELRRALPELGKLNSAQYQYDYVSASTGCDQVLLAKIPPDV